MFVMSLAYTAVVVQRPEDKRNSVVVSPYRNVAQSIFRACAGGEYWVWQLWTKLASHRLLTWSLPLCWGVLP